MGYKQSKEISLFHKLSEFLFILADFSRLCILSYTGLPFIKVRTPLVTLSRFETLIILSRV